MEIVELEIYTFDELEDEAKEKARDWWRNGSDYPWFRDCIKSIEAFADSFGVRVKDWSIGGGSGRDYIKTDATNANFRGVKLASINPEHMPTGYCLDASLWGEFHKLFKRTGDAKYSFEQALEQAISDINADIEYQNSDECVDDLLMVNDYKFTKEGRVWI